MHVADACRFGLVGLVGLSRCRRRKSQLSSVIVLVLLGILMMGFVRRWTTDTSMRMVTNGTAPTSSAHLNTSTTNQRSINHVTLTYAAVSKHLKVVINETKPASRVNAEQGSSSTPSISYPPQSSIARGQSGFNCEEVRNKTKTAAESAEKYVALNPSNVDSRRLGNQLFNVAAILMVARLTNRTAFFPAGWLNDAFDLGLDDRITGSRRGVQPTCPPCYTFHERHSMHFDERLLDLGDLPEKGLLLSGYFQSWKYLEYVEKELRCRLTFHDVVRKAADRYLEEHRPTKWERETYARIGVHVRRADFLNPRLQQHGYTTPTMTYFRSAIDYFRKRHWRIHLVVASDDIDWTKKNFEEFKTINVSVTFCEKNTGPVDLAILTSCHSLVLSTGTFGWWAAWLANVTTVYFKDWPHPGSVLESHLKREDFFPPHWIAI